MIDSVIKTIIAATLVGTFALTGCQKSTGPGEGKAVNAPKAEGGTNPLPGQETKQQQPDAAQGVLQGESSKNVSAMKTSPLTEQEQQEFEGGWIEPGNISQKKAYKLLNILLKGNVNTIQWYKTHKGSEDEGIYKDRNLMYQADICSMVKVLAEKQNKDAYNLILQMAEQKTDYPKAQACAAEALGWYGELKTGKWQGNKRAIPALKNIVYNKDPEVRLQAGGTLLSLGEADIALPVLDELAKVGIHQSTFALDKLFAPEERVEAGEKRLIVSHKILWDGRGKDILKKALNYTSNEVRAFAAARLSEIGEKNLAEPVLLNILKMLKDMKLKDYGLTNKDEEKHGSGGKEIAYEKYKSDRVALGNSINALKELRTKKAIPYLKDVINNTESSYEKNWAMEAIKNIEKQ